MVNQVSEHKHLGLILDSKLTFTNHINGTISKAYKLSGVLHLLSSYLSFCPLKQIYKLYIRPHFNYCECFFIMFLLHQTTLTYFQHYTHLWYLLDVFSTMHLSLLPVTGKVLAEIGCMMNWYGKV